MKMGACGSIVVKALHYMSAGDRFGTWWSEWFLSSYLILRPHQALWFTQPLTEMSTRCRTIMFLESTEVASAQGWQPYRHLWADCLDCVGSFLKISQPYRPPQPVTGIALFTLLHEDVLLSHDHIFSVTMPLTSQKTALFIVTAVKTSNLNLLVFT
jgi:hypothetical protein